MERVDQEEMEMTEEELRSWIEKQVESNKLLELKKTQLAQMKSLIERREKQTASTRVYLNHANKSVVECENSMKELYLQLGMVYRDSDSEDEVGPSSSIIKIVNKNDDAAACGSDDDGDGNDDDEAMSVDNGEEGEICFEVILSNLSYASSASVSHLPSFAAPELFISPETDTQCGERDIDSPEMPRLTLEVEIPRNTITNEVTTASPTDPASSSKTCSSSVTTSLPSVPDIEPNSTEESKTPTQPGEVWKSCLAATMKRVPGTVVLGKLPESIVKRLSGDEMQEEEIWDGSDALWEPPKGRERNSSAESEMQEEEIWDGSDALWEPPKGRERNSSAESEMSEDNDEDTSPRIKRWIRRIVGPNEDQKSAKNRAKPQRGTKTKAEKRKEYAPSKQPSNNSSEPPDTGNKGQSSVLAQTSVVTPSPSQATQPATQLSKEEISVGMVVLARTKNMIWNQGKIVEIHTSEDEKRHKYMVHFDENGKSWLPGHHIAFDHTPSLDRLFVGARVVAKYQDTDKSWFYCGTLAELPNRKNRMRFLVFFDDGTPSYVSLPVLHMVCRPLQDICEDDIEDKNFRDFLQDYLKVYPNPPMAQYRIGQPINTEYDGVQKKSRVEAIDCSLLHILFLDDKHKEWVYKGSMRLQHIANMKEQVEALKKKILPGQMANHSAKSFTSNSPTSTSSTASSSSASSQTQTKSGKHSTTVVSPAVSVVYTVHRCCPACLGPKPELRLRKSPLSVPLLCGFIRMKAHIQGKDKMFHIFYRSPCSLTLASMAAVQDYLQQTRCDYLSLDMFCLDPLVSIATTLQTLPSKVFIPDLSQGRESQPLSCSNELNLIRPRSTLKYSKQHVGSSDVNINTSMDFMVGCDCTDSCRDRLSCSCHQLTIQATALGPGGPEDVNSGYSYKRLEKRLLTGVYECNALCRCDPRLCSNRVVQHGLQLRLQVFMTYDKGWGVRCLDDVPKGAFICCYAGKIVPMDKQKSIAGVHCAGLNLIEGAYNKEGYESEANCSDSEMDHAISSRGKERDRKDFKKSDLWSLEDSKWEEGISSSCDSDSSFKHKGSSLKRAYRTRRITKANEEGPEKEAESKNNCNLIHPNPTEEKDKYDPVTTRGFFGDEQSFIIDSTVEGNVARYLNHSCSPNLFGQNVFVDTHDLRFPWLAFFSRKCIKAGTELTWDYRSGIGAETEMVVICRCGSSQCRGKL